MTPAPIHGIGRRNLSPATAMLIATPLEPLIVAVMPNNVPFKRFASRSVHTFDGTI
jgi:hypothetical protein